MRTVKSDPNGLPQIFPIAVGSIACTSQGLVSITTAVPHRLTSGAKVRVYVKSATGNGVEGDFVATVTASNQLTYQLGRAVGVALPAPGAVTLKQILPATEYEPFVIVRNNRMLVDAAVPDASLYVADGAAHDNDAGGPWVELLALDDCVFAELASSTLSGFAAGMPLPKGTRLKGVFTHLKLTSGKLLCSR